MKKADILAKLKEFPYPRADYWVITGGAMVLYGIREETHDVDLGCTSALADRLESDGYAPEALSDGRRFFHVGPDIEVFENWLDGEVVLLEGVPLVSIDGLIAMKRRLGREKDLRDIRLIEEWSSGGA